MIFGRLTDEVWAHWRWNWEENGFEIYETAGTEYINQEMYQQIGAPVRRRLDVREIVDSLMNRYYGLEEELEYANEAERDLVIRFWIDGVRSYVQWDLSGGAQPMKLSQDWRLNASRLCTSLRLPGASELIGCQRCPRNLSLALPMMRR
jgi:hypothetical protein